MVKIRPAPPMSAFSHKRSFRGAFLSRLSSLFSLRRPSRAPRTVPRTWGGRIPRFRDPPSTSAWSAAGGLGVRAYFAPEARLVGDMIQQDAARILELKQQIKALDTEPHRVVLGRLSHGHPFQQHLGAATPETAWPRFVLDGLARSWNRIRHTRQREAPYLSQYSLIIKINHIC